jgi:GxxExxY protein
MVFDPVSGAILRGAIRVHSALGPGLLESAYRACLCHELTKCGLVAEKELALPVHYDGLQLDVGYRIDLLVEDSVIVELKVVSHLLPVHKAQLLSYMKLSQKSIGLLINFHVPMLRDGVRRMVL